MKLQLILILTCCISTSLFALIRTLSLGAVNAKLFSKSSLADFVEKMHFKFSPSGKGSKFSHNHFDTKCHLLNRSVYSYSCITQRYIRLEIPTNSVYNNSRLFNSFQNVILFLYRLHKSLSLITSSCIDFLTLNSTVSCAIQNTMFTEFPRKEGNVFHKQY